MANQAVTQASNYFDLQGLDQLRQKAQGNSKESIREVANQFESMFATMLIKSMREANEAFETDSPFNNKQTKFYTDMQDKQLALDISRHGSLGLADALVRQLDPNSIVTPKSLPIEQLNMPNSQLDKMHSLEKEALIKEFNKPDQSRFATQFVKSPATSANISTDSANNAPEFSGKTSFINTLMPYAKKVAQALGVSPAVLIAQSALETGWGKKIINKDANQSSFNLFNIKANKSWQGDKVSKDSLEVEDGIGIKRRSDFRAYENIAASFADYQDFIVNNKRYKGALKEGANSEHYIESLQQAGYATDPQYAEKIKQIMRNEEFQQIIAGDDFNG
ncbi:flagellar assembly peptidoglycan hydrolase FlgJ [Psychromonas sp. MME2]|uniref:flagellar assembly peptidoglycan hydrolase FlgJ n=1 Tax=unclassified Psychromonas TaxID=2614957 RepID=UPI00339D2083